MVKINNSTESATQEYYSSDEEEYLTTRKIQAEKESTSVVVDVKGTVYNVITLKWMKFNTRERSNMTKKRRTINRQQNVRELYS